MVANFFFMPYPLHPKAQVIKDLKAKTGASYRDIAKRANVPHNYIGKYLDGLMKPHRDSAFDDMETALHEIEREKAGKGTLPVNYGKGLPVPIFDASIDVVLSDGEKRTGVYVLSLTLVSVEPVGKPWGRKITTRGLAGLVAPGDHVALDSRRAEPGHLVEAMVEGEAAIGVLAGAGKSLRLTFTSPDFEDVPILSKDLRGVVIAKAETRSNDVKVLFEYPHGMNLSDKN